MSNFASLKTKKYRLINVIKNKFPFVKSFAYLDFQKFIIGILFSDWPILSVNISENRTDKEKIPEDVSFYPITR